jgi:putative membrane protein
MRGIRGIRDVELKRIEQVVHDVERETAGEIVVVIAKRSAPFVGARAAFAFVVGTIEALVLSQLLGDVAAVHPGWVALAVPMFFALGWLIASIPPITRTLAGDRAVDAAVMRGAQIAFLEHGVHATRTRAGVLVYLSLFERRVQVLGDSAVHALVGDAGWAAYAARVGDAMKKRSADDLVTVVRELGITLAKAFPRARDDVNELPDHVRFARG